MRRSFAKRKKYVKNFVTFGRIGWLSKFIKYLRNRIISIIAGVWEN